MAGIHYDIFVPPKRWVSREQGLLTNPKFARWDKPLFLTIQSWQSESREDGARHKCALAIDFDGEGALREMTQTTQFLTKLGVPASSIVANLSGRKGGHLFVPPTVFAQPWSAHSTVTVKAMVGSLKRQLELETVDMSIYTKRRVLRVPNTVHEATGNRAVLLQWDGEAFEEVGGEPDVECRLHRGKVSEPAFQWYSVFHDMVREEPPKKDLRSLTRTLAPGDPLPVCVEGTLGSTAPPGKRNSLTYQTAIFLKDAGYSAVQAEGAILRWTESSRPHDRSAILNAKSVVNSVYGSATKFYCGAIKAAGAQCNWPTCNFVKETNDGRSEDQLSDSAGEPSGTSAPHSALSLDEAVRAQHWGKDIAFEGTVARSTPVPMLLPDRVKVACMPDPENDACARCPFNGRLRTKRLTDAPESLLALAQQPKGAVYDKIMSAHLGIPPKCPGKRLDVETHCSALFLVLQPHHASETDTHGFRENEVLLLNHHRVDDGKPYRFEAQTYPDPKTHKAVHIASKAERTQTAIERFQLTEEMSKDLEVFQPQDQRDPEQIKTKLFEVHEQLQDHVHGIQGRQLHSIAAALQWHSVISFPFMGRDVKRGWIEALFFGDTAQGKTEIIKSLQEHYGLGRIISGENCSAAGLLAGVDKMNGQFVSKPGLFIREDMGFVGIDEYHGAPDSLKRLLSDARGGVINMSKVSGDFQQFGRCRKCFLSNCIDHRNHSVPMASKKHGIMHVLPIMGAPEDVRRLDYVVGFAQSDAITEKMYMQSKPTRALIFTQERSRALLHWVWSRKMAQVEFEEGVERFILDEAQSMCKSYDDSIPLCDSGSMKLKLAKIAIAIAAHCFSCSEDGQKIIVTQGHAIVASWFLNSLYTGEELQFDLYSDRERRKKSFTEEDFIEFGSELEMFEEPVRVLEMLMDQGHNGIDSNRVMDALGYNFEKAKQLIALLTKHHLVRMGERGFVETPKLTRALSRISTWWDKGRLVNGSQTTKRMASEVGREMKDAGLFG